MPTEKGRFMGTRERVDDSGDGMSDKSFFTRVNGPLCWPCIFHSARTFARRIKVAIERRLQFR